MRENSHRMNRWRSASGTSTAPRAPGGRTARIRRHPARRSCGWESLMKNVTLGNVTMSHRTRERPAECLASLSHSTMIGLPRAQH
ncbi:hypothetical protein EVAR_75825_1 [Eumeta japonica]|uniref:Uncharacterized protein n=1 Tax=Eumeta variegata TaxID=151549 RepID=A0A4C1TG69_EUMVA|nr:hypothetical protein EVAR_75825_1 [Eumeta japonica]